MARLLVIYRPPADPQAFDDHYVNVHIPLAKKLPGLRRYDVSRRPIATLAGDPEPYLIGTLHFDDITALRQAFASPEGKACAADRRVLAPNDEDLQMYILDEAEV